MDDDVAHRLTVLGEACGAETVVTEQDGRDRDRRWPWHVSVPLDGSRACIGQARHLAADFLSVLQTDFALEISPRAVDLTRLVVSELVTNAYKYAPGPVLMDLWVDGGVLEIVVQDASPVLPVARAADAGRVGQHGLEIVRAVAASFAAHRTVVGKRLTVQLSLTEEGQPRAHQYPSTGIDAGGGVTSGGAKSLVE